MLKLKQSQQKQIHQVLNKKHFTCTTLMAGLHITDYRSRLSELRKAGVEMSWRWCETHEHAGHPKEWRLV